MGFPRLSADPTDDDDIAATARMGRVLAVRGLTLRLTAPGARLGDRLAIHRRGRTLSAEVVGFEQHEIIALALEGLEGVGPGDPVEHHGGAWTVPFGFDLLGRVVDARGRPMDQEPAPACPTSMPLLAPPPSPFARVPSTDVVATGIRAIDGLCTLARGQRIGLFSGGGVGKTELLGQLTRNCQADVIVVGLIGERGREVTEFIHDRLGTAALGRTVVVVATSDAPALERVRAAQTATAIAEGFRDAGRDVLLLMDSITRVARAGRELGLAAGEPPGRRGYPPSVYALLPQLLERPGVTQRGSITAIYAVLTEGDALDEPVADEVRSILDGHLVLSRRLAEAGHYPALDVGASLSRLASRVTSEPHRRAAQHLRRLWAAYEEKRDLVALGAYRRGADRDVDEALERWPQITAFLRQAPNEPCDFDGTRLALERLAPRSSIPE